LTSLFGARGRAALALAGAARTLLAFDFDGTLAPIVRHPAGAAMRGATRDLLREVALRYPCAIVSGRAVDDLRRLFAGVPVRWLVGNHGAEGLGAAPPDRARIAAWGRALRAVAREVPGVAVEDKGRSLAVHYRGAPDGRRARAAVLRVAGRQPGARLVPGKRVVNLVPQEAPDKGAALVALVARARPEVVLFAGDDVTDEDAFRRSLGVTCITVRVGKARATAADFFLAGQGAVDRLLRALRDARVPRGERAERARRAGGAGRGGRAAGAARRQPRASSTTSRMRRTSSSAV
jgi:trehalose 6-phosphate phosphatase